MIDGENSMHLEHVRVAAERGLHVFCEKPIGSSLRMAREIEDIVEGSGILFTTGFNSRFNPEVLAYEECNGGGGDRRSLHG